MKDLADYRRLSSKKKRVHEFPEGILDVIEKVHPEKYRLMLEGKTCTATLFSSEEWLDIVTKSRNSYKNHIQGIKLARKYSRH
ncbi:hypothetical protein Desor_2021 [Desulfosporosinus orientis DSM 765]|uniref:Uncharacterized protein n=1 Tax=Desulfosporosinus orientis (strain ATCC 19365 / DSM 765 / NCIMB 8382 / VKM B-1628 / Singapore I) TaxID=768706 RepID=G7WF19_DESOD|nr:hypothetical protein [Desulfosporosinus orientis]AET67630.1 hypothetical protein Desor_2021 [Desulfosporosinus orientis DSM 765]